MSKTHDTPDEWTHEQQALFVRMLRFMSENPGVFQHPDATPVPLKHWECIAHNASWHAADVMGLDAETALVIVDADTDEELARESGVEAIQ